MEVRLKCKEPIKGKSSWLFHHKGFLLLTPLRRKKYPRTNTYDYYKRIYRKSKDFKRDVGTVEGLLRFDENLLTQLEPKKILIVSFRTH
jgi:hypothetical protein